MPSKSILNQKFFKKAGQKSDTSATFCPRFLGKTNKTRRHPTPKIPLLRTTSRTTYNIYASQTHSFHVTVRALSTGMHQRRLPVGERRDHELRIIQCGNKSIAENLRHTHNKDRRNKRHHIAQQGQWDFIIQTSLTLCSKGGYTSTALLQRRRSVCNRHHLRPPRWPTPFRIRRLSACGVS